MSNGRPVRFQTHFLAALILSIGGCSADPGAVAPAARHQTDAARHRVWSLSRGGVSVHDRAAPAKAVAIPLPDWQWAGPPYGCLPDLALGPQGEAVITSDVVPTLWRIDPETLAVTVHPLALDADSGKDVGFTGLVYSSEHRAYIAASALHRSLWRIDPELKTARKIPLTAPVQKGLSTAACKDFSLP